MGRVISLAHAADGDGPVGVGKPTCVSKDAPHNAMYTLSRLPASQIISHTSMHVPIRVNSVYQWKNAAIRDSIRKGLARFTRKRHHYGLNQAGF